jgi:hypothetical protein
MDLAPAPTVIFNEFSIEDVRKIMPKNYKVTTHDVSLLNSLSNDPELHDSIKSNFMSFTDVLLNTGKGIRGINTHKYLKAVQFSSYRLLGDNATIAWKKTFPDRLARYEERGAAWSIPQVAYAYNKSMLVTKITQQTLVPSYILNNGFFQEALNTQVGIMRDTSVSPRTRVTAAESVLKYTEIPPELAANGMTEGGSVGNASVIELLAQAASDLAKTQRELVSGGFKTSKEIAGERVYTLENNNEED